MRVDACTCSKIDKMHPQASWDHHDDSGIESECHMAPNWFAREKIDSVLIKKERVYIYCIVQQKVTNILKTIRI